MKSSKGLAKSFSIANKELFEFFMKESNESYKLFILLNKIESVFLLISIL